MSDKYKDLEGSVPVNGDITPITRKPIAQLDSSEWDNMTTTELVEQRMTLFNRMTLAQSMGQMQLVPAMQRGLNHLDLILKERRETEDTHLI
jgi:hypothetical protein